MGEVLDDYLATAQQKAEYRENGDLDYDPEPALSGLRGVIKRLRAKLGHIAADELTTADTKQYRKIREEREGVIFSTVNHELSYLRAALNDGTESTPPKVTRAPKIWLPSEESQVREGFIERIDTSKSSMRSRTA